VAHIWDAGTESVKKGPKFIDLSLFVQEKILTTLGPKTLDSFTMKINILMLILG
jgi:hypothetical protein